MKTGKKDILKDVNPERRRFIKKTGELLLTSAAITSGFIKPDYALSSTRPSREINIATFGPSHCATPFVYSKLTGAFKDAGLNVNLINYPSMPLIAKDLISGKLDFGQLIVPLVFAIHTGAKPFFKATPMAITQITGTNGSALMIRKDLAIDDLDDFKGKIIANHSKLSVNYLINMMFLETYDLNYQKDVNFKIIELKKIVNAMRDEAVDIFVMPEPINAMVEHKEIGYIYMLSKYIWPNHPCCSLVTRKDSFEQNRNLVHDVTRVVTKSALTINHADTRADTIKILQNSSLYKYDQIPREALLKAFVPGRSDFYPFPYQSAAIVIVEIMKKYQLLANKIDTKKLAQEVFQSQLSRQVLTELGAEAPDTDYRFERVLGKIKYMPT